MFGGVRYPQSIQRRVTRNFFFYYYFKKQWFIFTPRFIFLILFSRPSLFLSETFLLVCEKKCSLPCSDVYSVISAVYRVLVLRDSAWRFSPFSEQDRSEAGTAFTWCRLFVSPGAVNSVGLF